jgi:hypothetical protein
MSAELAICAPAATHPAKGRCSPNSVGKPCPSTVDNTGCLRCVPRRATRMVLRVLAPRRAGLLAVAALSGVRAGMGPWRAAGVHAPRSAVDPHTPRRHTQYAILGMEVTGAGSSQSSGVAVRRGNARIRAEDRVRGRDRGCLAAERRSGYTTLGRLERDGLVTAEADADGQKVYEVTDAGRDELGRWFDTPVPREVIPRQELAIKLVFAMRSGAGMSPRSCSGSGWRRCGRCRTLPV